MTVDGYDWSLTLFGWYLCACHVGQHMHTDIPIHTGKGTMKMCECVCVCVRASDSQRASRGAVLFIIWLDYGSQTCAVWPVRESSAPCIRFLSMMTHSQFHSIKLCVVQITRTTAALCVPEICKQSNPREYKTLKTSHICEDYGKFGTPQKHKEDTSSHDSCQTFSNISKCWTLFTLIVNIGLCDVTRAHTLWHQQLVDKTICGTKWEIKSVWIL